MSNERSPTRLRQRNGREHRRHAHTDPQPAAQQQHYNRDGDVGAGQCQTDIVLCTGQESVLSAP